MRNDVSCQLSVVMERRKLASRWADHQWEAMGVLPDRGEKVPRCVRRDDLSEQWVFPALTLSLHTDEADNYLLNLAAPEPRLFVIWRMQEDDQPMPAFLTVSYGEAARMMDASEQVDGVILPADLWLWIAEFARHFEQPPEPKHERRFARSSQIHGGAE